MPFGYPLMLEVAARRVVVIGAGAVAEGKVEGLLAAGATDVSVIATGPAGRLGELERDPAVRVERRGWQPADLDGAVLCVAWSSDPAERDAIAREARARHVLVNVMDDVANCDVSAPSVVRRGDLVIAIATGGRSPALARRLRERLEEEYGAEWAEALRVLHEVRELTLPELPTYRERAAAWREALDLEELLDLVRAGRAAEARDRLTERLVGEAHPPPVPASPTGRGIAR